MTAPNRSWFQFSLRKLFVIVTFFAIGIGALVWLGRAFNEFASGLAGYTGPVELRDDWPRPLKELLDGKRLVSLDESTIQVHSLCQGFDPEYVWRMEATPGLFDDIQKQWKLSKISDPQFYKLEGYKSNFSGAATPAWWSPRDDEHTSFYVSQQVLARGKSDHFHVALDDNRNTIFVYYWFNF